MNTSSKNFVIASVARRYPVTLTCVTATAQHSAAADCGQRVLWIDAKSAMT